MINSLLLASMFESYSYGYNKEYENLSEEEKMYMDFCDQCLYKDTEEIRNASTDLMFMLLEVVSKMNTKEELTDTEVSIRKNKILENFSESDKEKLNDFLYACIQTMGIYSEERVEERKLKKERK